MSQPNHKKFGDEFAELLFLARSGNDSALGMLLENHRNYLLLIANQDLDNKIKGKVGPSDIVQESLLTAHQNFPKFHGDSNNELIAWLRQILINDLNQTRRTYRGTQKRQVDWEQPIQSGSSVQYPLIDPKITPQSNAVATEESALLKKAISSLADDHRKVIELHSWQHKDFEEIGKEMDRTAAACRKLWTRAILKLQQSITDYRNLE